MGLQRGTCHHDQYISIASRPFEELLLFSLHTYGPVNNTWMDYNEGCRAHMGQVHGGGGLNGSLSAFRDIVAHGGEMESPIQCVEVPQWHTYHPTGQFWPRQWVGQAQWLLNHFPKQKATLAVPTPGVPRCRVWGTIHTLVVSVLA